MFKNKSCYFSMRWFNPTIWIQNYSYLTRLVTILDVKFILVTMDSKKVTSHFPIWPRWRFTKLAVAIINHCFNLHVFILCGNLHIEKFKVTCLSCYSRLTIEYVQFCCRCRSSMNLNNHCMLYIHRFRIRLSC